MRLRPVLVLALLLAAVPLGAQQRKEVERRWALAADGSVKIFNFAGSIRVIGWQHDSVAVTGTLPAGLALFGGGSRAALKVGVEGEQRTPESAATIVVYVPTTANVWVRGAATDIRVERLIGTVDVGTVGGRLRVVGAPRSLNAETMDGALEIIGSPETLRARTATGDLRWAGTSRDAHLSSVSGTLRIVNGPLERARFETVSGAVFVSAPLRTDAMVTVETHSGNIEFALAAGHPTRLSADAARISGAGVTPFQRPDGGKHVGARTFDLHFGKSPDVTSFATVTVRSFKGELLLVPHSAGPQGREDQ